MSKKWTVFAVVAVSITLLLSMLPLGTRGAPQGETRIGDWGVVAIDLESKAPVTTSAHGDVCGASFDGVSMSFKIYEAASPDSVINVRALKQFYQNHTDASQMPVFDVSPEAFFLYPTSSSAIAFIAISTHREHTRAVS